MNTAGLRLDQAPPLAVPARFFLVAPLAVVAAGLLLLITGPAALSSPWPPQAVALAHLGTLGVLGAVMMGALYQMIPVVASIPVPGVRLGIAVHALLVGGLGLMVAGLTAGLPLAAQGAAIALGLALVLFLLPVGVALARAPAGTDTVHGMRLAVGSLALLGLAGVLMLQGWAGQGFPGPRLPWIQAHLAVALLGWVGGLLTSVSWTLAPMFWLAPPPSRWQARGTLAAVGIGVVAVTIVHVGGAAGAPWQAAWAGGLAVPLAALPAVLAVWVLHPALTLRALARQRRPRPDGSLAWWRMGLLLAPLVAATGLAATLGPWPRLPLLFGWLAVWGWAGSVMLGTLTRIVPFLVWFHRYSPLVGRVRVPSMRALLPDPRVRQAATLHLAVVALGAAAIIAPGAVLARLLGLGLLVEGALVGLALVHVLRQRPDPDAQLLARSKPPAMR